MEQSAKKITSVPTGISKAQEFIDQNIHRNITLKEVADHVYLNANYFSVLFREWVGINFSEYITQKRLLLAKRKLLETDQSIARISLSIGYQTSKYFTHLFKKHEGMTPTAYRKQLKKAS
ncbi:MAG: AraC family transcriptional regulator [Turicibacter sp.]|nr:AraC family transcriptional regulator [Turicibacter sp.]